MASEAGDVRPFFVNGEWTRGSGSTFESIESGGRLGRGGHRGSRRAGRRRSRSTRPASRSASIVAGPQGRTNAHGCSPDSPTPSTRIATRWRDAQMQDNGKTVAECRSQATAAAAIVRYYAAVCETFEDAITPTRGDFLSLSTHEPVRRGRRRHAMELAADARGPEVRADSGGRQRADPEAVGDYAAGVAALRRPRPPAPAFRRGLQRAHRLRPSAGRGAGPAPGRRHDHLHRRHRHRAGWSPASRPNAWFP